MVQDEAWASLFGDYTQQWDEASVVAELNKKGNDLVLLIYGADENALAIQLSVYDLQMRQVFTLFAKHCKSISSITFGKIDVSNLEVRRLFDHLHISSSTPSAPAIVLFPSYARNAPVLFDSKEHDVSLRGMANFLLNHKLWSREEKQLLASSLGQTLEEIMYQPGEDEQVISEEEDLFRIMDKNGDQQINKFEMAEVLGMKAADPLLSQLFAADDKDKSGFISWTEFSGPKGPNPNDGQLSLTEIPIFVVVTFIIGVVCILVRRCMKSGVRVYV